MKAVLMPGDRVTKITEMQLPKPEAHQVILQNKAAGLCGSDLHLFYRPSAQERNGKIFGLQLNSEIIPGHEGAGVIHQIGESVTNVKVGDRVAVNHISGCGQCVSCRRGWDLHCQNKTTYALDRHGFLADFTVVDSKDCVMLPKGTSFEEGAFWGCGGGTAWSAINRLQLPLGSKIGIVGLGPVGAAAVIVAVKLGLTVYGFDPVGERRDLAKNLGAKKCFDPSSLDSIDSILGTLDGTVEASGSSSGRILGLDLLKVWGRSSFVGFADDETKFDVHEQIIKKQVQLNGVWLFTTPDLQEFINIADEIGLSLLPLILHKFPLSEAVGAVDQFDKGSSGKTMIVWP